MLAPPDREDEIAQILEKLKQGERIEHFDTVRVTKDGRYINLALTISPIKDTAGRVTGASTIAQDITHHKLLQAQLLHAQKVDSIGRLAAGMAHEFNNLLGAIMGFNSLALQKAPPSTEVGGYLQEVDKAVSRAAGLVHQLLAFSRVQSFEPKVLDLNSLILDSDRMLRRLVGADVELVTVLAPDLGLVKADPGQLTQVLVNLAVNARDAMPQGGKLIVSSNNTSLDKEQAVRIGVSSAGQYVVLTVTDTGTGMTERVKAHLFEPFFTTKEVGKGTGLGLSTCYGIITQSGGHIEVFSEPGQGAAFKIYLPAAEAAAEVGVVAAGPDDEPGPQAKPQAKETVLLAEDDPLMRKFVSDMLRIQGYTVLEASNGGEALSLVQGYAGGKVHLLVADLVMPLVGGKELAGHLRGIYPEIKVLFISGYNENPVARDSLLDAGVDFLAKPLMPDELALKVSELLDRAKV
jgi:signal transduction histidine kinase/CheY-like chemotaxis protein